MHISAKCSVAVHCLIFLHEYGETHRVTSELLAGSTGCNPVTIRTIMSALKRDGILTVKPGTGGAALCCPLDEISLYRICMAVEPGALEKLIGVHPLPSALCPVGRNIGCVLKHAYAQVSADLRDSLRGITMAQIVEEYHAARAAEQ